MGHHIEEWPQPTMLTACLLFWMTGYLRDVLKNKPARDLDASTPVLLPIQWFPMHPIKEHAWINQAFKNIFRTASRALSL
jgi:hypothetical protein